MARRVRPETFSKGVHQAIKEALTFSVTDEHVRVALKDYGAWHLPTLKIEAENVKQILLKVNPDGGMAWGTYHSMIIALVTRETQAKELMT